MSNLVIDGLQISVTGGGGPIKQFAGSSGTGNIVKNCIVQTDATTSSTPIISLYGGDIINCVAITTGGGSGVGSGGGNVRSHNVTLINLGTAGTSTGFNKNYDAPVCTNCVAFGFATAFRSGVTGNYNASDIASPPGANSIGGLVFANQFQNTVGISTLDLRPKPGAALIGAGTRDATYTADLDILKQTRSSATPTIGAMEYATVNPSATIASTEANDVSAITANQAVGSFTASVAYIEANDTSSITASVRPTATISWTEANDTSAITATSTSGITTGAFKNNTGSVLASLTGLTVTVLNLATLAFVKTFTSQTTNASGVMSLTDPLLVSGTWYAVVTTNASGVLGVEKYQAA